PAISCESADEKLASAWNDARRRAVRSVLPPALAALVETRLDRYAAAWRTMHADACRATRDGEQSAELLDLRMACLQDRLDELRATSELAPTAPDRADALTARLSPVAPCADVGELRAAFPLPRDPASRAE